MLALLQPFMDRAQKELQRRAGKEVNKLLEENLSEEDKQKLDQYKDLLKTQ